mgnify:CR=1 FL=1
MLLISQFQIHAQQAIVKAKKLIDANKNQEAINVLYENDFLASKPMYNQLMGLGYKKLNDVTKAVYYLNKCIKQDSRNAVCYYLLGSTYIDKLNKIENFISKGSAALKAKKNLLKAVEINPSHINARVLLSNFYMNSPVIVGGSTKNAKIQANEIVKYDAVMGTNLLATIALKNKDYNSAENYYLKVLELDAKNQRIRYSLSSLYYEAKNYQNAFKFAEASIKQFPKFLQGYYQYAKIASTTKQNIELAIYYIQYFINNADENSFPKAHWAYYRLGLLEHLRGNKEDAKKAINSALKLKPSFSQAEDLLIEVN